MSLLFSKYTKPNLENFENAFDGQVDLSNNIVEYNQQIANAYNSLVDPTTEVEADDVDSDIKETVQLELLNKKLDKTPTVHDVRISDEKTQIEQIKYLYLAGTVALVSLIILINEII